MKCFHAGIKVKLMEAVDPNDGRVRRLVRQSMWLDISCSDCLRRVQAYGRTPDPSDLDALLRYGRKALDR